jgi:hypothetical protein
MTRELVIAAYDKDYSWINKLDPEVKVTVYRKGGGQKQTDKEIQIEPNRGRCVHTFFNHLYQNYDNLSDYTFFAQDYPFDHWENLIEVVNQRNPELYSMFSQVNVGGYYAYHYNTITEPGPRGGVMWNLSPSNHHQGKILICYSNGTPHHFDSDMDLDGHFQMLFQETPPTEYEFIPGGHFGISKEHARFRSREFYKKIVDFLIEKDLAPWIIERLECYIFNPKYNDKDRKH